MRSNEEEDRYVAALAMAQLSELLHEKGKTGNGFLDSTDVSPSCEVHLSTSSNVGALTAYQSSQSLESPPLDLTLKKEIENEFVHKYERDKVSPMTPTFCSEVAQTNILNRNFMITSFSNNFESITINQEPLPAILIPNLLVMPEMSRSQLISVHKGNLKKSKSVACSLDDAFGQSNIEASFVGNDFRAFAPRGLSSISEFYRSNSSKNSWKEQPPLSPPVTTLSTAAENNENKMGNLRKPGILFRSDFPSGLSSIKDYYVDRGLLLRHPPRRSTLLRHPIAKRQNSADHENPAGEDATRHRVPPLPLCVTENETFVGPSSSGRRRMRSEKRPERNSGERNLRGASTKDKAGTASRDSCGEVVVFGKKRRGPSNDSDSANARDGESTVLHDAPGSTTKMMMMMIPLNVLEMSSADDSTSSPPNGSKKKSKGCRPESAPGVKGESERGEDVLNDDDHGDDNDNDGINRWVEQPKSDVSYDFLNPDKDGDFILHIAASRGDREQMDRLLRLMTDQGGDVNCKDLLRQTPLHIAVETNNLDILGLLLERGANPCLPDLRGRTCLHLAVLSCNPTALEIMLPYTGRFNSNALDFEGRTALHLASASNDLHSTRILASSSLVNVDAKEGKSGKTSLYISAEKNHPRILELLLECGASDREPDYSGFTPYQVAVANQNDEIVKMLDDHQRRNKS